VRSRDSDTVRVRAPTSPSCSKRARLASSRPWWGPKREISSCSGTARSASSVVSPSAARRAAVFGPIPGSSPGGEPAKRSHACSRLSTTKPAGFSASDATFATSLLGPMPTEQLSWVARLISATSRRIAARGECSPSKSR